MSFNPGRPVSCASGCPALFEKAGALALRGSATRQRNVAASRREVNPRTDCLTLINDCISIRWLSWGLGDKIFYDAAILHLDWRHCRTLAAEACSLTVLPVLT